MNCNNDCNTVFEMFSMKGVYEKVEKDFVIPVLGKNITYDTPNGKFTVQTAITDKSQFEIILLTQEQAGKYLAPCNHEHNWTACSAQKATASFCKSQMSVQFHEGFNDDDLKQRLCALMKRHNDSYAPGITSVPPTKDIRYIGFIDPKDNKFFPFNKAVIVDAKNVI